MVGLKFREVMKETAYLLPPKQRTIARFMNLSAGVIESLFGKYKSCKADNPLYGVTPLVLSLCVHTHWEDDKKVRKQDIQNALQSVSMANLSAWKGKYLIENQVVKRKKRSKCEKTFGAFGQPTRRDCKQQ